MQIIELLTPTYDAAWLPWAVTYFFLIGIATTTALTASVIAITGKESSTSFKLLPALMVVLATTAISAPVSLLADLAQPARFWHFYAYPTTWSWMSIGAFLLPVFVGLSLLSVFLWWKGNIRLLKTVSFLLIISSLSVLLYTGMEVMVIKSRPLWNTVFLPINFALTGWMASMGAVLLVSRWFQGGLQCLPMQLVKKLTLTSVILLGIVAIAWALLGMTGSEPSFKAALVLFERFPVWRLGLIGSVLIGALVLAMLTMSNTFLNRYWSSLFLSAILLAAPWVFRWVVFMSVQGVPKYGAGLYLYNMPLGSDGLAGIIGMFGLCIAVISVVTLIVDRYPSRLGCSNYLPSTH